MAGAFSACARGALACRGATTAFSILATTIPADTLRGDFAAAAFLFVLAFALLPDVFAPRFGAAAFRLAAVRRFAALTALDFAFFALLPAFLRFALRTAAFFFFGVEAFALARDAVAALGLVDRFLAMMVAAGKGFWRVSQSAVML